MVPNAVNIQENDLHLSSDFPQISQPRIAIIRSPAGGVRGSLSPNRRQWTTRNVQYVPGWNWSLR